MNTIMQTRCSVSESVVSKLVIVSYPDVRSLGVALDWLDIRDQVSGSRCRTRRSSQEVAGRGWKSSGIDCLITEHSTVFKRI
jgi:hypothetical protein